MANEHPRSVKVDKARFDDARSRRGLKITQMSKDMGYGKSNLGMMVSQGYFNPNVVVVLEALFGIKKEEYELQEEKPEKKEKKKETTLDMNELYKTIYTAVFNAMKQAWKES